MVYMSGFTLEPEHGKKSLWLFMTKIMDQLMHFLPDPHTISLSATTIKQNTVIQAMSSLLSVTFWMEMSAVLTLVKMVENAMIRLLHTLVRVLKAMVEVNARKSIVQAI